MEKLLNFHLDFYQYTICSIQLCNSRLEKTLTHSQFVDPPEVEDDDSDDDQIIETEEELRKSKVTSNYLENVCI